MGVTVLPDKVWGQIEVKRGGAYADEMEAVKSGKVVFVPIGERRADTLRVTLYEAAKRAGMEVSVRSYTHDGTNGFAIKQRPERAE